MSLTPLEEKFEHWRRTAGLFVAPALFALLWLLPLPLAPEAHRLAAILGLIVTLWVTESIPLPATALLGPTLAVLLGVAPVRNAFAPFADPLIFVFLGGFILAEALFRHGVNERIAFRVLSWRWVGSNPSRILFAYGAVTALISMWISNTATTAMMFPIGLSIVSFLERRFAIRPQYGAGLMLMTAFAASVGGMGTPVGSPPNLVGIGLIERMAGTRITFFQWMMVGVPLVVILYLLLYFYLNYFCKAGPLSPNPSADRAVDAVSPERLPLTRGQRNVLLAFSTTVLLWVVPGVLALTAGQSHPLYRWTSTHIPESVAALIGAVLLFVLPVDWKRREFTSTWEQASHIDWGVILLFGGGVSLGEMAFSTRLAESMGNGLVSSFSIESMTAMTIFATLSGVILSETTSNLASATMIVPVVISAARAAGLDPVVPALAACLGSSMGFMLPVSTPPNAIVYATGKIPVTTMIRYGLLLDIIGTIVIVAACLWLVPFVL